MPNTNRRIMRRFRISEISAVDRPAQQGALATIIKRDAELEGPDEIDADREGIEKMDRVDLLTSSESGHQHGLRIHHDGEEGTYIMVHYAAGEGGETHDHQVMIDADGNMVMSENQGHTHEIDRAQFEAMILRRITKDEGDDADPLEAQATTNASVASAHEGDTDVSKSEELATVEARAVRAEAIVALNKADREFFDSLEGTEAQDAFLAKSAEGRAEDIAKAAEANAVVYTDRKGREYTKADGERMIELAKEADAEAQKREEAAVEKADADLTKRAEALDFLPGSVDSRKALLKAIDGIEDEAVRGEALAALKSNNAANQSATETIGSNAGNPDTTSTEVGKSEGNIAKADAEARLDELAKAYATEHKVTEVVAYNEILKTPEGGQLYAATV